jgi:hypothetical protein
LAKDELGVRVLICGFWLDAVSSSLS